MVLLEDNFDVVSNYFMVDSYMSLLAMYSDSNEQLFNFFKENDPIWNESYLEPFKETIKKFKEVHEKMTENQKDKEYMINKLVSEHINK